MQNILDVKSNGFLSCQNIDISYEKIYIDPSTYKVKLLYLPIKERLFDDVISFESELRNILIGLIQSQSTLFSNETRQFVTNLRDASLSLDNIYASIKEGKAADSHYDVTSSYPIKQMKLVALNAPAYIELVITKDEYIIGKKAGVVDGLVSYNKMISRSHCKIIRNGTQYMIMDLQSLNGTFVNGVKLDANKLYLINNGDVVKLANSDFKVVMN